MKILDLVLDAKTFHSIISGEQEEVYRSVYHTCDKLLNVDREGYGYFHPPCRGDFEDKTKPSQYARDLAQYVNKPQIFKTCSFADFMPRKGFKCAEYLKIQ